MPIIKTMCACKYYKQQIHCKSYKIHHKTSRTAVEQGIKLPYLGGI